MKKHPNKMIHRAGIIFSSLIDIFKWMASPGGRPPLFIPRRLMGLYTMNGKMRIRYCYLNSAYPSSRPIVYKKEEIDSCIEKIRNGGTFYYGETDSWLYRALEKFGIKDKEVAIMGSAEPVYESVCISFGGKPTTIEYNKITSEDGRLGTMTVDDYDKSPKKFDAAFSVSSFEHDGLGRYGDALRPDGDLLAMEKMRSILKPGGMLFLAVPVGRDTLVWNLHRVYGKHRLPLLLKDWELLGAFGFHEDLFNKPGYKQPVFVLKNIKCLN